MLNFTSHRLCAFSYLAFIFLLFSSPPPPQSSLFIFYSFLLPFSAQKPRPFERRREWKTGKRFDSQHKQLIHKRASTPKHVRDWWCFFSHFRCAHIHTHIHRKEEKSSERFLRTNVRRRFLDIIHPFFPLVLLVTVPFRHSLYDFIFKAHVNTIITACVLRLFIYVSIPILLLFSLFFSALFRIHFSSVFFMFCETLKKLIRMNKLNFHIVWKGKMEN